MIKHIKRNISSKKYLIGIIFLFTFFFTFFYIQGLTYDDVVKDDYFVINGTSETSLGSLSSMMFLKPFTGDVYYWEERPAVFFFLKILKPMFGLEPLNYYILCILVLCFTGILIFLLLHEYYKTPYCALAALFFVTLPIVASSMIRLWESAVLTEFFIILSLFIFLKWHFSGKKSFNQIILFNILLFFTTLIAIKTKQNAITIIPTILLFLILTDTKRIKEYLPFFVAIGVYISRFLGTMESHNSLKQTTGFILKIIFKNPNTGFGPEPLSFISPLSRPFYISGSLFGSLGFLLSWLFLILFIVYIYKFFRKKKYKHMAKKEKFMVFVLIWLASEIFLLTNRYFSSELRYFVWVMIPFTLLVFIVAFEFFDKRFVRILFVLLISLLIIINIAHTLYAIRGAMMGTSIALHGAIGGITQDIFGNSDYQTIGDFHLGKKSIKPEQIIESNLFIQSVNYGYNNLNLTLAQEKAKANGFSYIIFLGYEDIELDDIKDNSTNMTFMNTFSFCDDSLYCKIKRFFGLTENDAKIYLYKIESQVKSSNDQSQHINIDPNWEIIISK